MPNDISSKPASKLRRVDIRPTRSLLRGFAPGRMNSRMAIVLLWVTGMAAVIWWTTSRLGPGSGSVNEQAGAMSGPPPGAAAMKNRNVELPGKVKMELIWIEPGNFTMGSPSAEAGRIAHEGPQTQVTLTKGFWLGKYVVTQGQYEAVMGMNPSFFTAAGKDTPVEQVAWGDAMTFCQKLTAQEKAAGRLPSGYVFSLPTEAQWEYACRAGTTGPFAGNLGAMAWYADNSGGTTHRVGTKQPNAWGLYDMHGNVWEWCADWYGPYPGGSETDPAGAASGPGRVFRGGSWHNDAASCRSAYSTNIQPGYRSESLGFRLALRSAP